MEEIIRFVTLAQTDRFTLTDLCEWFGISRKTGYKHLERYAAGGLTLSYSFRLRAGLRIGNYTTRFGQQALKT